MSRCDENTSMHERRRVDRIDLHKPKFEQQTEPLGIAMGVLLGVIAWIATIALALAIWRWIAGSPTLSL